VTLGLAILTFVSLQRGAELLIARRNTRRLMARGAVEVAPGHYPLIVLVHASWLAGLWALGWNKPVYLGWLAAFVVLQALRVWILATLGERWTTRIVVLPHEAPIRRGPYRLLSHPNYWVVAGEIAVLPLAFGLPWFALVFSMLNAAVLTIRIRAENRALSQISTA
jgi:methyltransferase